MDTNLIIVGTGDFGEIADEYFAFTSEYAVVAFSVERKYLVTGRFRELPVIPFESLEDLYPPSEGYEVFVAISFSNLNRVRARLYQEAKAKGYTMASYVSPWAFVWDNVEMGEHCFIFEDNRIQPFCKVGDNVVMWSGNHIGHHTVIGNNCFIASEALISGGCEIGDNTFIGVNATIAHNIKIGEDCIIGAGAVVTWDVLPNTVLAGHKARVLTTPALDFKLE